MNSKIQSFKLDLELLRKVENMVASRYNGNKSSFYIDAVQSLLDQHESMVMNIPEDVKVSISFLFQLLLTIEDEEECLGLVREEMGRLWRIVLQS